MYLRAATIICHKVYRTGFPETAALVLQIYIKQSSVSQHILFQILQSGCFRGQLGRHLRNRVKFIVRLEHHSFARRYQGCDVDVKPLEGSLQTLLYTPCIFLSRRRVRLYNTWGIVLQYTVYNPIYAAYTYMYTVYIYKT